jgi:hypothetical protein
LKPDWWGSPRVQEEKYQEKPVKGKEIIIITTTTTATVMFICQHLHT